MWVSDNWKNMSNFEILTMQLKEFEKWYELAIAHHLQSLVVIHVLAAAKLRDRYMIFETKKRSAVFINQYDPRFWLCATEIFLQ